MHPLQKTLILSLLANTGIAVSAEQIITPLPASNNIVAGQPVSVTVNYSTANPTDNTLTGLGLRIHWDSTKLSWINLSDEITHGLQGVSLPEADSSDFDSDPATDQFVLVAWADIQGNWPGADVTLPVELYTANFTVAANIVEGTTTSVKFSTSSSAAGFDFQSSSVILTELDTLVYVPLDAPCRIIDTRQTTHFTDNSERSFLAWGQTSGQGGDNCSLPMASEQNAIPVAIAANFTAVSKPFQSSGNLTAYSSDNTLPATSLVNFQNNNIANSSIITLSPNNLEHFTVQAKIRKHNPGGSLKAHMVADALGYFFPRSEVNENSALGYIPLVQACRIVDTRGINRPFQEFTDSTQAFLAWGTEQALDGQRDTDGSENLDACLPEDDMEPTAMMANVTVAAKAFKSKGNILAYQHGVSSQNASLVNFGNNNIANAAIISLTPDAAHHFDIEANILGHDTGGSKQVHVIVDTQGYFYTQTELAAAGKSAIHYIPLAEPCRIVDTRGINQAFNTTDQTLQGFRAWGTIAQLNSQRDENGDDNLGACTPETGKTPSAMVANLTIAAKGFKSKGNVTAFSSGNITSTSSLINFQADNIANSSIIALNSGNAQHFNIQAQIFNHNPGGSKQVHVIVDVMGYFYP